MAQKKKAQGQYSTLTGIHRAVPIILFAVAVFTMFCFITQDIGALGHAISSLFLGLFSYGAYAIPVLLALHAIFYPSDINEKRVLSRVIFSLIAITFIAALSYSITYWKGELIFNGAEFYKNGQEAVGGGFIGSTVGFCLIKVFGRVGLVIIAAAILAIYVSYFFARGQEGISKVFYNILKGIVIALAAIEKAIKRLFRSVKNAKSEKLKREAEEKNIELTDDEFFAVDNGMQKLSVSELGIKETRTEADLEANPTLHEKIFYKSALSKEEAEEMAMRERAEEMFRAEAEQSESEDEEAPTVTRRRLVNVTYDDPDSKIGRAQPKVEPEAEAVFADTPTVHVAEENADSVFTGNFDPFGMMMSEDLASKPSSRSLLDERPGRVAVEEQITELTEAQIEREKRIREFEMRKAAIVGNRKAIPVENDGEFTGTPKSVDFRERSEESERSGAVETESSSFVFEKTEKVVEPPRATPANYTAIGFGTSEPYIPVAESTPAFIAPETIYSYEPPKAEEPVREKILYTANDPAPFSAPYVEEETAKIIFEKKPERSEYTYASEPVSSLRITPVEDEPVKAEHVPVNESVRTEYVPESEPVKVEYAPAEEPKPAFTFGTENTAPAAPAFEYTSTSNLYEESDDADYVPEFKPYRVDSPEEINESVEEDIPEVKTVDNTEPVTTLKIEREYVGDEYESEEAFATDESDDYYSEEPDFDEEPDEELAEDGEIEPDADEIEDGAGYEDEEIPPEEQNPVVQGYKDMFTALHEEDPVEESEPEEDRSHDYELVSPDEIDDTYDDYDEDEDYDAPPFEHTTVKPEPKPKEKKEEKPEKKKPDYSNYKYPPIDLLGLDPVTDDDTSEINENTKILIDTLASFNVTASIKGVDRGPRITRYEVVPARGVKVNAITALYNDIALNLAKAGVRMEAPIPGKSAIGFEIPNKHPKNVRLRELLECDEFKSASSNTYVAVGKDVAGNPVFGDIAKYPHALICGATGTGKSVCINSLLISMLYHSRPDEIKLIMIDPKMVEFNMYSGIPHLLIPVITEAKQAAGALMWAVEEMQRRYEIIAKNNVRNTDAYNEKVKFDPSIGETLPKIVIVIDELADLMMQVKDPVEDLIMRIAQKARAAGIHLLIGTQRPSVQVVTGNIKANIPSRIACKVTSQVDSRTILDDGGAEKLLGRGDMLYWPGDKGAALRVQGAFVSDKEVEDIMEFIKSQVTEGSYDEEVFAEINKAAQKCGKKSGGGVSADDIDDGDEECGYYSDQQFLDAVELAIRSKKISTSLLQRKLSIGYGKAAKYIDAMEEIGIVSEPKGQKPRDVLISMDDWHEKLSRVSID